MCCHSKPLRLLVQSGYFSRHNEANSATLTDQRRTLKPKHRSLFLGFITSTSSPKSPGALKTAIMTAIMHMISKALRAVRIHHRTSNLLMRSLDLDLDLSFGLSRQSTKLEAPDSITRRGEGVGEYGGEYGGDCGSAKGLGGRGKSFMPRTSGIGIGGGVYGAGRMWAKGSAGSGYCPVGGNHKKNQQALGRPSISRCPAYFHSL